MKAYVDNSNNENSEEVSAHAQFVMFASDVELSTFRNLLHCKYDDEDSCVWSDSNNSDYRGVVVWHEVYTVEDMYNDLLTLGFEIVLIEESFNQFCYFKEYLEHVGYFSSTTTEVV